MSQRFLKDFLLSISQEKRLTWNLFLKICLYLLAIFLFRKFLKNYFCDSTKKTSPLLSQLSEEIVKGSQPLLRSCWRFPRIFFFRNFCNVSTTSSLLNLKHLTLENHLLTGVYWQNIIDIFMYFHVMKKKMHSFRIFLCVIPGNPLKISADFEFLQDFCLKYRQQCIYLFFQAVQESLQDLLNASRMLGSLWP